MQLNTEQIEAINWFISKVEKQAEENMLKTHKLEGAHYAAMKKLQKELEDKQNKN